MAVGGQVASGSGPVRAGGQVPVGSGPKHSEAHPAVRLSVRASRLATDWVEAMRAAASLGADGVELEVEPEYGTSPLFDAELRRRMREAAGRSVPVLSVRLGALERYSFCAREDRLRAEAELLAIDVVDACSELGCPTLVLPLVLGQFDPGGDPRSLWAGSLRSVSYAAEDKHVTLAVEPQGAAFAPDADSALGILRDSGTRAGALALEAASAPGALGALPPGAPIALVYLGEGSAGSLAELSRLGWSGVAVVASPEAAAILASAREALAPPTAPRGSGQP